MDKIVREADLQRMQQRAKTLAARAAQCPVTIEAKVSKSKLNLVQKEHLKMVFLEEKWCHNYLVGKCLSDPEFSIFHFDYKKLQHITHLDKDRNPVEVEITHIPQQCKQGMITKMCANVKSLSTKKKQGKKVGSIGFKTEGSSIFLKQYGRGKSYEIVSKNRIKLAGLKKAIPVMGLKQLDKIREIDPDFQFSSATLDRDKVGDYFFHVTVWVDKEKWMKFKESKENITSEQIGIDFGCETTITTSDGEKLTPIVNETERLKRLQGKKSHQVKHSNRWWKTILEIRKEYRHITNRKNDIGNKEATRILRRTREVVIQDEQIELWKETGHGKKIQHSIHGRMMKHLKASPKTIVLDKWIPTTKLCNKCGHTQEMPQEERTYTCAHCGTVEDRDFHSAENMLFIRNNFDNVTVGPDGSSFNRADFDRRLAEIFGLGSMGSDCSTTPEVSGG